MHRHILVVRGGLVVAKVKIEIHQEADADQEQPTMPLEHYLGVNVSPV